MQVGDRVRVNGSRWKERNGQTATITRFPDNQNAYVRFESDQHLHLFGLDYLEPIPKDLALGTRVRVRQGYVRAGEEAFVVASDSESESAFRLRFDNGDEDWYGDIALEVLPPEDSEERDKDEDALEALMQKNSVFAGTKESLPFSELSLLDVLIAALSNEDLGRVVRALREADLL